MYGIWNTSLTPAQIHAMDPACRGEDQPGDVYVNVRDMAGHYHNGDWYTDTECPCGSQAGKPVTN